MKIKKKKKYLQVHLGRGVWLSRSMFNEEFNLNSTSLFVKMLFTVQELRESTATGEASNRKQTGSRVPKKLYTKKSSAIRGMYATKVSCATTDHCYVEFLMSSHKKCPIKKYLFRIFTYIIMRT